ncbi:MAG: DNA primase [Rubricoccaceae bacterium]|nr:DNA primase [Rubricoccaceae bacterium]
MPRISDTTVDQVRSAVDLVDVVGDYVRLKKQGTRFVGLCPFHNEKTPSFSVDARQDLYYCFGCKRGGDLFKFIEEMEGVGFLDAVRLLAERAGIEIVEEGGVHPEADEREAMHAALRFAAKFFFDQLKSERGKRGLDYLLERGFSKETIKTFGMGYAPDGWDNLLNAATKAQYKPELLEKVGLVKKRAGGEGYYDVFRDRVMFPILSPVGKVLGFGGRVIPGGKQDDDFEAAKYINSPETPVYHKSEVLYGLKQAKSDIRGREEGILVEGYADVVSLHQAGIKNAVASSGTALTPQQVGLLARYARQVVLLYDADSAGASAALKAIDVALTGGLAVFVVQLPDGADPDSFVQQFGADAFRKILRDERVDFVSFVVNQSRKAGKLDTGEGKGAVAQSLMRAVARIDDLVAKEHYIMRTATELGVPDVLLRSQYRDALRVRGREMRKPVRVIEEETVSGADLPPTPPVQIRPEEHSLLRLMFEHGEPMLEHILGRMGLDEFSPGLVREIVGHMIEQYQAGTFDGSMFRSGALGEEIQRFTAEVMFESHALSDNWTEKLGIDVPSLDEKPYEAANSAMRLLKLDRADEAIERQKRRVFAAEQAGEDIVPHQAELQRLLETRKQIEQGDFLHWGVEVAE